MRGLFGTLFEAKSGAVPLESLPGFMLWGEAKSGARVTFDTALQVTTVLACVKVIAEGIAQAPLKLYRPRREGGADPATDHPLYRLLHRRPNDFQTSFEFRETLLLHLALCGNAFVYVSRGAGDRILELIIVEPGKVQVIRNPDLTLSYRLTGEDGRQRVLTGRDIWHVRGSSWNGWMGLEIVRLAREAIGLSMALEEAHARLHKNGATTTGTYAVDGALSEEQHVKLTAWIKKHISGENRSAPLVLDNGARWLAQQMSGVDAQHVETRRMQVEEVCRVWRVMPIMVGAADKTATYASSEQMFIAHVVHCLTPWAERLEQSLDVNLLTEAESDLYFKFNLAALMRGALKDQGEYFARALGSGGSRPWLTQDEVRALIELNPMGGDAARLLDPPSNKDPIKNPAASEPGSREEETA